REAARHARGSSSRCGECMSRMSTVWRVGCSWPFLHGPQQNQLTTGGPVLGAEFPPACCPRPSPTKTSISEIEGCERRAHFTPEPNAGCVARHRRVRGVPEDG